MINENVTTLGQTGIPERGYKPGRNTSCTHYKLGLIKWEAALQKRTWVPAEHHDGYVSKQKALGATYQRV